MILKECSPTPFFHCLKRYMKKVFLVASKFILYRKADGVFLVRSEPIIQLASKNDGKDSLRASLF